MIYNSRNVPSGEYYLRNPHPLSLNNTKPYALVRVNEIEQNLVIIDFFSNRAFNGQTWRMSLLMDCIEFIPLTKLAKVLYL